MRDRFVSVLSSIAETDRRVMLVTGDLGFGVLDEFRSKFPAQFINAGVSEQNMTLLATGLALEGRIVFTYSIANFPTLRCLEMIRNDAAYHRANVKVVAVGGGFSYGPLGISHHATEDISILRALPDVQVYSPSSLNEVEGVTRAAVANAGTAYIRLDKDVAPHQGEPFQVGVPRRVCAGRSVAIFVTGGILTEVLDACVSLRVLGIEPSVYSVATIKPIDTRAVADICQKFDRVVTVEEHTVDGGLSGVILEALADRNALPKSILRIGLQSQFSSVVGSQRFLRSVYHLDATAIARRIAEFVSTKQAT